MLENKQEQMGNIKYNEGEALYESINPVSQENLQKTYQPIESSLGLGNEFYTSPDVFKLEKKELFDKHWTCIGFGKDVPQPNTAYPVNFMGTPMVIVRDEAGKVKVFHNICRHRGMILVDRPQQLKKQIRCPYHSWCYGLDGRLAATPHFGGMGTHKHEALNPSEFSLHEVRSHLFMDLVFVNLSGDAPDFDEYAQDLRHRWGEFVDRPLHHGGANASFTLNLKTNWKFAVENYCESYHLPWVHPALNRYSKLSDHYTIVSDHKYGFEKEGAKGKTPYGWFSGQGTNVYAPQDSEGLRRFPDFEGLSDKWDRGAEYIALYPNVLFGVHRDHTFAVVIQPIDHETSFERVEIYFSDEEIAPQENPYQTEAGEHLLKNSNQEWVEEIKALSELWRVVFEEDIFVVEGMQKGRNCEDFDGGKLSPVMDSGTFHFHQWVATHFVK